MLTFFRRAWTDPVGSKVISAAILAAVGMGAVYWWNFVKSLYTSFANFLGESTEVWNWLLILVSCLALLSVIGIMMFAYDSFKPSASSPDPARLYRSDTFLGIKWRWKYDNHGHIDNMASFCPYCDFQLIPIGHTGYRSFDRSLTFRCENCERFETKIDQDLDAIEARVERSIQLKLRNGEWSKTP